MSRLQLSIGMLWLNVVYGGVAMSDEIYVEHLGAPDPQVRAAASSQILSQRIAVIREAVEVLKEARGGIQLRRLPDRQFEFNDPRLTAVKVLAVYRATEAVDELLQIINLKTQFLVFNENRDITLGDHYPAAGALTRIGKPAVRSTIWELTKEGTPQRRENLCWVIGEIEGAKVGRWRIEEMIAQLKEQQSAEAKAREARGRKVADLERLQPQAEQIERLQKAIGVLEELFPDAK